MDEGLPPLTQDVTLDAHLTAQIITGEAQDTGVNTPIIMGDGGRALTPAGDDSDTTNRRLLTDSHPERSPRQVVASN